MGFLFKEIKTFSQTTSSDMLSCFRRALDELSNRLIAQSPPITVQAGLILGREFLVDFVLHNLSDIADRGDATIRIKKANQFIAPQYNQPQQG